MTETCRLAAAIRGGDGAPDLTESVTNLGVNVAALAVLSFLVGRDLQAREKAQKVTSREEELGRLLVRHLRRLDAVKMHVVLVACGASKWRQVVTWGWRVLQQKSMERFQPNFSTHVPADG